MNARARVCAHFSRLVSRSRCLMFFLYARLKKPHKPNTPHTLHFSYMNLLKFLCVGLCVGLGEFCVGYGLRWEYGE